MGTLGTKRRGRRMSEREAEIEVVRAELKRKGAPTIDALRLAKSAINALDAHRAKNGIDQSYMERDGAYCYGCGTGSFVRGKEGCRHRDNPDVFDPHFRLIPKNTETT